MLLLDKGYFDYDHVDHESTEPVVDWLDTIKSEDELTEMLSMFGIGPRVREKPETLEEIQNHIIKQEKYGS